MKLIPAQIMNNKGFLFNMKGNEWFFGVEIKNREYLGEAIAVALQMPMTEQKKLDSFARMCLELDLSS